LFRPELDPAKVRIEWNGHPSMASLSLLQKDGGWAGNLGTDVDKCYSTRAAAEAAKDRPQDKEGTNGNYRKD